MIETSTFTHERLAPYVEKGLVRKQTAPYSRWGGNEQGVLTVYSYTQECQYSRAWDDITLQCRGLVISDENEILARPFSKFFNLGEPECPPLPDLPYEVYEKLDGSLLIAFWTGWEWKLATRGSFENQYTQYGYEYFTERKLGDYCPTPTGMLGQFTIDKTLLFEVVPPPEQDGMPRVVRHKPGCYLLGAVETRTGEDIPLSAITEREWSGPRASLLRIYGLNYLKTMAEQDKDTEGWVVRYTNGFRVKIKTEWYLSLFRTLNNLNEKNIRAMLADTDTALISTGSIVRSFPEEFRPEAEAIVEAVIEGVNARDAQIRADFEAATYATEERLEEFVKGIAAKAIQPCLNPIVTSAELLRARRKIFAITIKDNPDKGYIFCLLDGKSILRELILDWTRTYYVTNVSGDHAEIS